MAFGDQLKVSMFQNKSQLDDEKSLQNQSNIMKTQIHEQKFKYIDFSGNKNISNESFCYFFMNCPFLNLVELINLSGTNINECVIASIFSSPRLNNLKYLILEDCIKLKQMSIPFKYIMESYSNSSSVRNFDKKKFDVNVFFNFNSTKNMNFNDLSKYFNYLKSSKLANQCQALDLKNILNSKDEVCLQLDTFPHNLSLINLQNSEIDFKQFESIIKMVKNTWIENTINLNQTTNNEFENIFSETNISFNFIECLYSKGREWSIDKYSLKIISKKKNSLKYLNLNKLFFMNYDQILKIFTISKIKYLQFDLSQIQHTQIHNSIFNYLNIIGERQTLFSLIIQHADLKFEIYSKDKGKIQINQNNQNKAENQINKENNPEQKIQNSEEELINNLQKLNNICKFQNILVIDSKIMKKIPYLKFNSNQLNTFIENAKCTFQLTQLILDDANIQRDSLLQIMNLFDNLTKVSLNNLKLIDDKFMNDMIFKTNEKNEDEVMTNLKSIIQMNVKNTRITEKTLILILNHQPFSSSFKIDKFIECYQTIEICKDLQGYPLSFKSLEQLTNSEYLLNIKSLALKGLFKITPNSINSIIQSKFAVNIEEISFDNKFIDESFFMKLVNSYNLPKLKLINGGDMKNLIDKEAYYILRSKLLSLKLNYSSLYNSIITESKHFISICHSFYTSKITNLKVKVIESCIHEAFQLFTQSHQLFNLENLTITCNDKEEFLFFWQGFANSDKMVSLRQLSIKSFTNTDNFISMIQQKNKPLLELDQILIENQQLVDHEVIKIISNSPLSWNIKKLNLEFLSLLIDDDQIMKDACQLLNSQYFMNVEQIELINKAFKQEKQFSKKLIPIIDNIELSSEPNYDLNNSPIYDSTGSPNFSDLKSQTSNIDKIDLKNEYKEDIVKEDNSITLSNQKMKKQTVTIQNEEKQKLNNSESDLENSQQLQKNENMQIQQINLEKEYDFDDTDEDQEHFSRKYIEEQIQYQNLINYKNKKRSINFILLKNSNLLSLKKIKFSPTYEINLQEFKLIQMHIVNQKFSPIFDEQEFWIDIMQNISRSLKNKQEKKKIEEKYLQFLYEALRRIGKQNKTSKVIADFGYQIQQDINRKNYHTLQSFMQNPYLIEEIVFLKSKNINQNQLQLQTNAYGFVSVNKISINQLWGGDKDQEHSIKGDVGISMLPYLIQTHLSFPTYCIKQDVSKEIELISKSQKVDNQLIQYIHKLEEMVFYLDQVNPDRLKEQFDSNLSQLFEWKSISFSLYTQDKLNLSNVNHQSNQNKILQILFDYSYMIPYAKQIHLKEKIIDKKVLYWAKNLFQQSKIEEFTDFNYTNTFQVYRRLIENLVQSENYYQSTHLVILPYEGYQSLQGNIPKIYQLHKINTLKEIIIDYEPSFQEFMYLFEEVLNQNKQLEKIVFTQNEKIINDHILDLIKHNKYEIRWDAVLSILKPYFLKNYDLLSKLINEQYTKDFIYFLKNEKQLLNLLQKCSKVQMNQVEEEIVFQQLSIDSLILDIKTLQDQNNWIAFLEFYFYPSIDISITNLTESNLDNQIQKLLISLFEFLKNPFVLENIFKNCSFVWNQKLLSQINKESQLFKATEISFLNNQNLSDFKLNINNTNNQNFQDQQIEETELQLQSSFLYKRESEIQYKNLVKTYSGNRGSIDEQMNTPKIKSQQQSFYNSPSNQKTKNDQDGYLQYNKSQFRLKKEEQVRNQDSFILQQQQQPITEQSLIQNEKKNNNTFSQIKQTDQTFNSDIILNKDLNEFLSKFNNLISLNFSESNISKTHVGYIFSSQGLSKNNKYLQFLNFKGCKLGNPTEFLQPIVKYYNSLIDKQFNEQAFQAFFNSVSFTGNETIDRKFIKLITKKTNFFPILIEYLDISNLQQFYQQDSESLKSMINMIIMSPSINASAFIKLNNIQNFVDNNLIERLLHQRGFIEYISIQDILSLDYSMNLIFQSPFINSDELIIYFINEQIQKNLSRSSFIHLFENIYSQETKLKKYFSYLAMIESLARNLIKEVQGFSQFNDIFQNYSNVFRKILNKLKVSIQSLPNYMNFNQKESQLYLNHTNYLPHFIQEDFQRFFNTNLVYEDRKDQNMKVQVINKQIKKKKTFRDDRLEKIIQIKSTFDQIISLYKNMPFLMNQYFEIAKSKSDIMFGIYFKGAYKQYLKKNYLFELVNIIDFKNNTYFSNFGLNSHVSTNLTDWIDINKGLEIVTETNKKSSKKVQDQQKDKNQKVSNVLTSNHFQDDQTQEKLVDLICTQFEFLHTIKLKNQNLGDEFLYKLSSYLSNVEILKYLQVADFTNNKRLTFNSLKSSLCTLTNRPPNNPQILTSVSEDEANKIQMKLLFNKNVIPFLGNQNYDIQILIHYDISLKQNNQDNTMDRNFF